MKKRIILIIFIFVALFSALALCSCGEKQFAVTFETNGGGGIAAASVRKGEYVPLPEAPVREGFTFDGWYTDPGLNVPFDPTTEVRFDFTLYAKWKAVTVPDVDGDIDLYSVWFDPLNGADRTKVTAEQGKSMVFPADPAKSGFIFVGWYLDRQYTIKFTSDYLVSNIPPSSAFTVYAKWKSESGEDGFSFLLINKTDPATGMVTAEYAITDYDGGEENVVTPAIYRGTPVTTISDGAFQGGDFRSVTIGEGVTDIGGQAFYNCSDLERVILPATVKRIGEKAFYNCVSLSQINTWNCSSLLAIGNQAFYNCASLTEFTLPVSVSSVGWKAFLTAEDKNPSYLIIYAEGTAPGANWDVNWNFGNRPVVWNSGENNVASDGYIYFESVNLYALKGGEATLVKYNAEIDEYTLPAEVSYGGNAYPLANIAPNVFYDSDILTRVNIGAGIKTIGAKAFSKCVNLIAVTFAEDSVLSEIGASAFHNCENLAEITLPSSLTALGGYAFNDCGSLTALFLSSSVTTVGQYVFSGCIALTVTTDFAAAERPAGWDEKWVGNATIVYGE